MVEQRGTDGLHRDSATQASNLGRRGLLAGAAALAAGLVAARTEQRVRAALSGGTHDGDALQSGRANICNSETSLFREFPQNNESQIVFSVGASGPAPDMTAVAAYGYGAGPGIVAQGGLNSLQSTGNGGVGVIGLGGGGATGFVDGVGLLGMAYNATAASAPSLLQSAAVYARALGSAHPGLVADATGADAVRGTSATGNGVTGTSTHGYGVQGQSVDNFGVEGNSSFVGVAGRVFAVASGANTIGVQGLNSGTGTGATGVSGQCDLASGFGVKGTSANGTGVSGASTTGAGIAGSSTNGPAVSGTIAASATAGATAIVGVNNATGRDAIGVSGTIPGGAGANSIAVLAVNNSTGASPIGINGQCDATGGIGVQGASVSGTGVLGTIRATTAPNVVAMKGVNSSTGNGSAGVLGQSDAPGTVGVKAVSANGTALFATSTGGAGVLGTSSSGPAVLGTSFSGLGGSFQGGLAPLRLVPQSSGTGPPTTGTHQTGELYVDSAGALYFLTTGGTWERLNGGGASGVALGSVSSTGSTTEVDVIGGASNMTALKGVNQSTGGGGSGVGGSSANGNGVIGTTNGTGLVAGLYGTSATAYGIIGNTTAPFYSGLTATTATPNCAALAATSTNAAAFAAYFKGFTYVEGSFAVSGSKSAAVMHPDGTRRLLYCVESPEAWFEDFGTAKLVGGKADVKLDPDFAALVHADDYHVFLTERDGHHHLAATHLTPGGFSVEADAEMAALKGKQAADGAGSFSWRVVAKRKDAPGKRLEKLNVPKFNLPDPAQLPKPPLVPTKP